MPPEPPDAPHPLLCAANLHRLPAGIQRPHYALDRVEPGVLHLGLGNFQRAHQAVVFDDVLGGGDLRWGVCGLSLRSDAMQQALTPQDGLYTLLVRDGSGTHARIIGAVREARRSGPGAADPAARLAAPGTHLVTLTITEKGYDETGPRSAIHAVLTGLDARRRAGLGGLTLLSCDNLAGNGERLTQRLLQEASATDPALAAWIAAQVVCPNTMVDRIVPATTDADREEALALTGLEDAWPVVAEPFSQWVIEARGDLPQALQAATGVEWVDAVAPWEAMKLRLLNAAHSTLAYLGALSGLRTVDEAIADPLLRALVQQLWAEAMPTLPAVVHAQAPAYTARLLTRFENPALHHRLLQISADGSRKLPPRLLASISAARRLGAPTPALVLAVAAWMRFCEGLDDQGATLPLDDPLAASLRQHASQRAPAADTVAAVLALDPAIAATAADAVVVHAIAEALQALRHSGVRAAVQTCLKGSAQRLSSAAALPPPFSLTQGPLMAGRLAGKRILVTAAGAGIGRATVLMMAAEGAEVIATDVREDLLAGLAGVSGIRTQRLDVLNDAEVQRVVGAEPLDVLFNCAGYVHQGGIEQCDDAAWAFSFNLNVRAQWKTISAALPGMLARGGGSIINMASMCSSLKGFANRFAYGASKAAVIGLTKSVAIDYVARGIRCNCICPGTVDTPSLQDRINAFEDPVEARRMFVARQPMGRLATAEEIAPIAVYLASDESRFATGQPFIVDGGTMI